MVKKIVALSIAFVVMLTSILYGTVDFTSEKSPINFGEGDGENTVIATPEELEKLLNNIPSLNDYLATESILDVNPDFQTFTMVEDGGSKQTTRRETYKDGKIVSVTTENDLYHVLEICFANDCVYYRCEGETAITETTRSAEESDGGTFMGATRTVTSFDVNIYYSKDVIMLKYNDYSIANEEKSSEYGSWTAVVGEEDPTMAIVMEAIESCFGKWMQVTAMTEEDMANLGTLSEEEAMIEMMIYEFCNLFSSTWTDSIVQSTEGNVAYLVSLSNFINTSVETAFDKIGGDYMLKNDDATKAAYLNAITGSNLTAENVGGDQASASFSIESDVVTIDQNITRYGNTTVTIAATTTFKNIGNTVVSLKGETVASVADVLGKELRGVFADLMAQEGGQQ